MIALDGYVVEAHYPGHAPENDGWVMIINDRLEFCRGFLLARREESPRPAYRLRRVKDGKVLDTASEQKEAGVGMVAGWPTGEQLLGAARRLLRRVRFHKGYVEHVHVGRAAGALAALDDEGEGRVARVLALASQAAHDATPTELDGQRAYVVTEALFRELHEALAALPARTDP